jgi:hypothetical protein
MNLISYTLMKAKLSYVLSILAAFILPVKPLLLTVGLCIAADTVMGLYRAKKKKEKITSRKLSNVVSKMVLYQSAVLLFFILEKFLLGEFVILFVSIPLFLTKLVAATLCFIEIKSIDESYTLINGYSLWSKFKALLARAKSAKEEIEDIKGE